MKRFKKIATLTAALMIAAASVLPATYITGSAATDLTIKTTDGQTADTTNKYTAFQVFTGTFHEEGTITGVEWGSGVNGTSLLTALKADSTIGSEFTDCDTAAQVAAAIKDFEDKSTEANTFAKLVSENLKGDGTDSSNGVISNLDAGYYFVKTKADTDSTNTKYILTLVGTGFSNVTTKGDLASVEKKVYEDENGEWQDVADAEQGDNVKFRLAATLPSNYNEYNQYYLQFKDSLSAGFTDVGNVKYYRKDAETGNIAELSTDKVTSDTNTLSSMTFTCTDTKQITELKAGDTLIVEYTAKLSENAIVTPTTGNDNEVILVYSNNPNVTVDGSQTPGTDKNPTGETPEDQVRVLTYEFDGTKIDGSNAETKLADAKFKLYRMKGETKEYATGTVTGTKLSISSWGGVGTVITTGSDGKFSFKGLDDGEYYLEETVAPTGYNLLSAPIKITVNSTFTIDDAGTSEWISGNPLTSLTINVGNSKVMPTPGDINNGTVSADIENNKGSSLPSTGGMGTTIFYVAGGILVVGSGALLISKKRMKNKEK